MSRGGRRRQAAEKPVRSATLREWVLETVHVLERIREELFPSTGGLGRDARREILWVHVTRGRELLELASSETPGAPETNAADALRDAVEWFEELEELVRELPASSVPPGIRDKLRSPRWFNWALRLLPSAGMSRYGRLARAAAEVRV